MNGREKRRDEEWKKKYVGHLKNCTLVGWKVNGTDVEDKGKKKNSSLQMEIKICPLFLQSKLSAHLFFSLLRFCRSRLQTLRKYSSRTHSRRWQRDSVREQTFRDSKLHTARLKRSIVRFSCSRWPPHTNVHNDPAVVEINRWSGSEQVEATR